MRFAGSSAVASINDLDRAIRAGDTPHALAALCPDVGDAAELAATGCFMLWWD